MLVNCDLNRALIVRSVHRAWSNQKHSLRRQHPSRRTGNDAVRLRMDTKPYSRAGSEMEAQHWGFTRWGVKVWVPERMFLYHKSDFRFLRKTLTMTI